VQSRQLSDSDPAPALTGQISRVSIADLLSTLEGRGKSAVVRFNTPAGAASVWFVNGRLVDAEMGVLAGEAALYRILGLTHGTFEVTSEPVSRPRVIEDRVGALVAKRAKRAARWEDLVFGGPALDGVPVRPQGARAEPESADDRRLLKLVDGRRSLLEILDESRLDPVQALESFSRLQYGGHFTMERSSSRPPPPRPEPNASREPRMAKYPPAETTPPRTATLIGVASPTPVPPSEGRPRADSMPPEERQRAQTLSGPIDPSWLEPPRPSSNQPDSGPSISIDVPDESGLTETKLRAEREREAARTGTRSSWPSLEVGDDRPSVSRPDPPDESTQRSIVPSVPPPSGFAFPGALFGPYQVLFRLAQGSASSVFLCREAEHGSIRSLFAVKLLEARPEFRDSLLAFRAAMAETATLSHPNVTRLHGMGSFEDRPFVVSEYLEGCGLSALLKRTTERRPIPLFLAILFDAMRGLQAAHELALPSGVRGGLVHGNLCPRDLLLDQHGGCRVADLSVSYALRKLGVTDAGRDPTKLAYLSPERLLARTLDARSDVFSLGVILHDMLTGLELFGASTPEEVRKRVIEQPVEAPSKFGLRPPKAFDEVCLRALERDPDRRFESVREFLLALEAVAIEHDTLASSAEVASWIGATLGREFELRRLSILDASRRSRGNSRSPSTIPPPPVVAVPKSEPPVALPKPPGMIVPSRETAEAGGARSMAIVPVPRGRSQAISVSVSPRLAEIDDSSFDLPKRSFPYRVVAACFVLVAVAVALCVILLSEKPVPTPPKGAEPVAAQEQPRALDPQPLAPPAAQPAPESTPASGTATPATESPAPADSALEVESPGKRPRRVPPRVGRPPQVPAPVAADARESPVAPVPSERATQPADETAPASPPPVPTDDAPVPPRENGSDSDFRYGI
jgi:hypothetical protein